MREICLLTTFLSAPVAVVVVFGADSYAARDVELVLPALSQAAMDGQADFIAACAGCHGRYGEGSDRGPDLLKGQSAHPPPSERELLSRFHAMPEGSAAAPMVAVPTDRPTRVRIAAYIREMQAANPPDA